MQTLDIHATTLSEKYLFFVKFDRTDIEPLMKIL